MPHGMHSVYPSFCIDILIFSNQFHFSNHRLMLSMLQTLSDGRTCDEQAAAVPAQSIAQMEEDEERTRERKERRLRELDATRAKAAEASSSGRRRDFDEDLDPNDTSTRTRDAEKEEKVSEEEGGGGWTDYGESSDDD